MPQAFLQVNMQVSSAVDRIFCLISRSRQAKKDYSAARKTHLHQQVENQKEHAIWLSLPYLQKLVMRGEAK